VHALVVESASRTLRTPTCVAELATTCRRGQRVLPAALPDNGGKAANGLCLGRLRPQIVGIGRLWQRRRNKLVFDNISLDFKLCG